MRNLAIVGRILRATLRRKWVSLAAFAFGAGFFHAQVALSYPAIGGIETIQSVVGAFPPGLRTLLRIAPNLQAAFGVLDYLAFSWFHPVFLGLGAAFVVSRATDALAGEIDRGSIYLLLSRPLPRWTLVAGKSVEMVLGAGCLALAGWAGQVLGVALAGAEPLAGGQPLPLERFLLIAPLAWGLLAALGAGALVISSVTSRTALAGGLASAWTLAAFVLDVIPAVAESPLAWLNPWHYYFPQEVVATGQMDWVAFGALALWTFLATSVAAVLFGRRDLA